MNEEKVYSQSELDCKLQEQISYTLERATRDFNSTYRYPLEREVSDLKQQMTAKDKAIESLSVAVLNLSKGVRIER